MHDLLHSTTSCHFKICLKSHTIGTTARRDLTAAFSDIASYGDYAGDGTRGHNSLCNSLPFSGEAHGTGGLSVISLLQILEQCDLSDFDICFVQIGENDNREADQRLCFRYLDSTIPLLP